MLTVYLTARGDVWVRCSAGRCDYATHAPVELRTSPVWDHYIGILVTSGILHAIENHSNRNRETTGMHRLPDGM